MITYSFSCAGLGLTLKVQDQAGGSASQAAQPRVQGAGLKPELLQTLTPWARLDNCVQIPRPQPAFTSS